MYDYPRFHRTVRQYQPDALIAIAGPDIRWVGNEKGIATEPRWSPENESWWYPAECDVPNRPGWFWHESEDGKLKSIDELLDIYYGSVGRNCTLLLNVPVNNKGLISDVDVERLTAWHSIINNTFESNLAVPGMATADNTREEDSTWAAQNILDGKDLTF